VDVTAALEANVSDSALFAVVSDLATYPEWLDIVGRAELVAPAEGDEGPAWSIDLRGQLGPLRRSKRLRMVRTVHDEPNAVRFERREVDGRRHSPWILTAEVAASSSADSRLVMGMHYGGSMWVPLLDRVLADEIERSRPRLVAFVSGAT